MAAWVTVALCLLLILGCLCCAQALYLTLAAGRWSAQRCADDGRSYRVAPVSQSRSTDSLGRSSPRGDAGASATASLAVSTGSLQLSEVLIGGAAAPSGP